ncbi:MULTISPECIES: hypothetical protein [Hyphobacterium]|uniref:Uncharacterized protein n=1 Tax=Hyphobacterium vulgare TaxID=1736751 RepID=A0ABV6ZYJ7_9PROT
MRALFIMASVLLVCGCEELFSDRPETAGTGPSGPAVFTEPVTQTVVFSDLAPGRDMGFRLDSEITFGQRQAYQVVITIPAGYAFNGFTALGPAGTRIGAYGFEFNPGSPGPDRLFPVYSIDADSAWVDTNLDGNTNPLKPTIEYSQDGSQNHILTITLPRGGDGLTGTQTAGFSSDVMAFLRTGIFSNPATGGAVPITVTLTSVDPDTGDATDNAGSPPETFTVNDNVTITQTQLSAAVLPTSRSVTFETQATAFATIVNGGQATAENCAISLLNVIKGGFGYQTTDPNTNALTGTPNTPVDIPAGQSQSFVISFTPVQEFYQSPIPFTTEPLELAFRCSTGQAAQIAGVNQLVMSSGTTATADVIAIAATTTNDGILFLGGTEGRGAIGTAAVNIGASEPLTLRSVASDVTVSLCETTGNANGACLSAPAATLDFTHDQNTVRTFTVLVRGSGQAIANDPARNRIRLEFVDAGGTVRGSTSVAVTTANAPT